MAKSEIIDQLVILAEAFGLSFNDARMEIYANCLADLPIDKIRAGVVYLIKNRTFAGNLPTVAEIREAVEQKIPIETQAAIAWDKFRYALHNHCPYDSVKFDDPIISQIISVWGDWTSMGDWDESQTHYRRREFAKLYEAYAKSGNLPAVCDHHVGLTEYQNTRTGFVEFIPAPVLITWDERQGKIKALPYTEEIPRVKRLTAGIGQGGEP
jgi:hypothetical protein